MTAASKSTRIPPGLAKVRKELPPPGTIFRSKKDETRKRARERIRQELKKLRTG